MDNLAGGAGNDSFSGVIANVGAANTTGTTFQAGDVVAGGAGTDTLNISVSGGTVGTNAAVTMTGIERVVVNNVNGAAQSISMALADSSLTTVGHTASNDNSVTTFTGLNKIVASELSNGSAGITLTYNTAVVAGSADAATLTLANQTGGTFTSDGIETLNVVSNTLANTITLGSSHTAVNVSGAANLNLGTVPVSVATLNAAPFTGNLTATLSSLATQVVTGGAGNDVITAGTNLSGVGAVNAGAGTDTLVSTADAVIATAADGARYTNFETLSILAATTGAGNTTRSQDMSLVGGINTVNVTSTRADGQLGDTTHGVTLSNLSATLNTLNITGQRNNDLTATDDFDVTVTATRAINTAADAITVNLGTSTATVGTTATATGTLAAGGNTLALSLANEESITINSLGGATGTNFLAGITDTSATSLTFTGARDLSFASLSGTATRTIDGSAMTGALIMGTNAATVASTITGGAGADTLTGGSAADNISGGAGNDSISGAAGADVISGGDGADTLVGGSGVDNLSGGAGNDTFLVTTSSDFTGLTTAEVVSGGDGTDNLLFSNAATAYTIAATDLAGINSIETITINGTSGAGSVTLTDAVFTANGAATLAVVDGDLTTAGGSLTVNASALTAANSVTVTANTATAINDSLVGGAGADTFRFSTTTGLESTDTVTGGAGTDTISLSAASAAVTAVMNGVTGVERVVTTGTAGNATITLGADTVIAAAGTLTTDATSLTSGSATLTYNGSAVFTATKIQNVTGGSGDDAITGGAGNDIIAAGDGNDSITGGAGIDNLSGGAGNDTFTVGTVAHFVGLTSVETVSGGAGNDTLTFNVGNNAMTVAAADLLGINSVETINVVSGNATAAVTLSDAVFTANGATSIALGSDSTSTAAVQLSAAGISSANSVAFTAGRAAATSDSLVGGAGNDSFAFNTNTSGDALAAGDTVNGGAGTDSLTVTLATNALTAVTLTNVSNIERLTVSGTTLNAGTITLVDGNFASVTGAVITASSLTTGTFSLDASAEVESTLSITGGSAADTIIGGQAADTISGGVGADVITGGLGADNLTGGLGADTFVYASVAQSNGTNTDTITDFTTGTDKLQVTLDYSTLVTALDINAVRASAGVAGVSAAQDTLSGQRGQYVYDTTASQLLINFNADNMLTTADYRININPASTASASIVDGDINFVINGGTAADVIVAGAGADTINGGNGDNNITGGAGNDSITTGTGADTIRGGTGADSITPGAGNDTVIVASNETSAITSTTLATPGTLNAAEAFTWSTASGYDTITGFANGDTVQLFTTGTTAITTSGVVVTNGGTIPSATTGGFAAITGTQTSATVFTANAGGADTLLVWDADGTGAGTTYAAIVLVGYNAVANDTVSTAGLFTAVA